MAALEFKASQLSHEVELGRPDVAMGRAEERRRRGVAEPEVVRHHMLSHEVIGIDSEVAGLRTGDDRLRRGRLLGKFGDPARSRTGLRA